MQPHPIHRRYEGPKKRTVGGTVGFALAFLAVLGLGYAYAQSPSGTLLGLLAISGLVYAGYKLSKTAIESMYNQVRSINVPGIGTVRYRLEP